MTDTELTNNTQPPLTPVQQKMISGSFFIDSHHNIDFLPEAMDLVERGLLTFREGGDSQYTSYHFEPKQ